MVEGTKPGTEVDTGSTYFTVEPGVGSQAGIYFIRLDGETGEFSEPTLIDDQPDGHQFYPDISADGGVLHAIWYDTRNDPEYSLHVRSATTLTGSRTHAWTSTARRRPTPETPGPPRRC